MPRLFVLSGNDLGRSFAFDAPVVVGRANEAEVSLRVVSVSRRHARLYEEDGDWWIEDLGSSNGVRLAGERVERALLADGDVFRLGEVELRFRLATEAPAAAPGAEPPPAEAAAPAPPVEAEIELEGEWDESAPPPAAPLLPAAKNGSGEAAAEGPAAATRPLDAARARQSARAAALGAVRGEARTGAGRRVLQYSRIEQREGLLTTDLAQQPAWLRWLLVLGALALCAALAWGAFTLTRGLRAERAPAGGAPAEGR